MIQGAAEALAADGYVILRDLHEVFVPVRDRLGALLHMQFPDAPDSVDVPALSAYLNAAYLNERDAVLAVYSVLDRTPELVRAGIHNRVLAELQSAGIREPILSSYPTWRLDLYSNPPQRTFPWHQEKYHELFSDLGVSVWAPLHPVSDMLPSNTLWVKPGSHLYGVLKTGTDKFDIIDERVAGLPEIPLRLAFGEAVLFSNLLMHRSGLIKAPDGMRLSVQLRYDDLQDAEYRGHGWPANFRLVDALSA